MTCAELLRLLADWGGEIIAALAGALAGAGLAFLFQNSREDRIKRNERFEAVIRAQHSLYFMWMILANIRFNRLDPRRAENTRHRSLGIIWTSDDIVEFDFDAITFLHRREYRSLLTNLFLSQRACKSAIESVDLRNKYFSDLIPGPGAEYSFQTESKTLGQMVDPIKDSLLESATNEMYKTIDNGMKLIERTFADLRKCAKEVFPDEAGLLSETNLTKDGYDAARGASPPTQQV